MAITFRTSTAGGGTTGTAFRTAAIGSAVIQVGDLLVVAIALSGNTSATPTCSDDQGGTYTRVAQALRNSSADNMAVFVRDSLISAAVLTTISVVSGSNTAGRINVLMLSGALRTGSTDVVRKIGATPQVGTQANGSAGATPAPVLPAAALTGNLTLSGVANGSSTPVITVPSGWTVAQNSSVSNPTTGLETNYRDSGFTGTTITFGGTSATAWSSFALELDATLPSVSPGRLGPNTTLFAPTTTRKVSGAVISLPTSLKAPTATQITTKIPPRLGNTQQFAPTKVTNTITGAFISLPTSLKAPTVLTSVRPPVLSSTQQFTPTFRRYFAPPVLSVTQLFAPTKTKLFLAGVTLSGTLVYTPTQVLSTGVRPGLIGPNTQLFAPTKTKLTITGAFIGPTGVLFVPGFPGTITLGVQDFLSSTQLFEPVMSVTPGPGGHRDSADWSLRFSRYRDQDTYMGRRARRE